MARAPGASQAMNTPNRLDAIIVPTGVKKCVVALSALLDLGRLPPFSCRRRLTHHWMASPAATRAQDH